MKGTIKRILSVLLIITMLFPLSSCGKKDNKGQYVSRAEWVTALGEVFGLSQYLDDTPHYSDVGVDSELFDYVQSCYEWGVISTDTDKFNPDDIATLGFAVSSAVMAITDGVAADNEDILNKAIEYGLLSLKDDNEKALRRGLTYDEADAIISLAKEKSFETSATIKNDISFQDKVKDYSGAQEVDVKFESDGRYTLSAKIAGELSVGDILMVQDGDEQGSVIAVKINELTQNDDGTYSAVTSQPELEEVVDIIDVEGIRNIEPEYITPAEGVELIVYDDASSTAYNGTGINGSTLVTRTDADGNPIQTASGGKTYEFKTTFKSNGTVKVNASYEDEAGNVAGLGISVGDSGIPSLDFKGMADGMFSSDVNYFADAEDKEVETMLKIAKDAGINMPDVSKSTSMQLLSNYSKGLIKNDYIKELVEDKDKLNKVIKENTKAAEGSKPYKSGYEATVSVKISNFAITPNIHYKWYEGIRKMRGTITTSADIETKVKVKGTIGGQYKLADIKVPIVGPVTLDVKVYFYFDLNGEISLSYEYSFSNKVTVSGTTAPKVQSEASCNTEMEISVDLEAGGVISVGASILGLEVLSVGIKVGAGVCASTSISNTPALEMKDGKLILSETYTVKSEFAWYLPVISIQINKNPGNLLGKIGISAEFDIITKDNIKDKKGLGAIGIYKEIWNSEASVTYKVECPLRDDEESTSEYVGDYLSAEKIMYTVDIGGTQTIKVDNIPNGYLFDDLVWESSDTSIATVDKLGKVTGISDGVVTITISTSDGKYEAPCMVSVQ